MRLPLTLIPVSDDAVKVPIHCLVLDCRGNIALESAPLGGLARATTAKKAKRTTYGIASFEVKAGATRKVKVKLSRAGRRFVKSHRKAKAWANVRFSSGGGTPQSVKITLKR